MTAHNQQAALSDDAEIIRAVLRKWPYANNARALAALDSLVARLAETEKANEYWRNLAANNFRTAGVNRGWMLDEKERAEAAERRAEQAEARAVALESCEECVGDKFSSAACQDCGRRGSRPVAEIEAARAVLGEPARTNQEPE